MPSFRRRCIEAGFEPFHSGALELSVVRVCRLMLTDQPRSRAVGVGPAAHIHDPEHLAIIVDAVADLVRAAPRDPLALEWCAELLTYATRLGA